MANLAVILQKHENKEDDSLILAIDPGTTESAFVIADKNLQPVVFDKIENAELLRRLQEERLVGDSLAVEMIASYGMPVGQEVFDTCIWVGRFWEAAKTDTKQLIYRKDVKMNLCQSMKANDATVKQALIDRFAYGVPNYGKGKKAEPGWFYGFRADIWSAYAVGVTYHDLYLVDNVGA